MASFAPTALDDGALEWLACPACRAPLQRRGSIVTGSLVCSRCGACYPVGDGLAHLAREAEVPRRDRRLRAIYDALPGLHDPLTDLLEPLHRRRGDLGREGYLRRLELASLRPGARLLEVGIGAGVNVGLIRSRLPAALPIEYVGVDLSRGMLEQCARRLARGGASGVRLLLGDAHRLPLRDHACERVFSIGSLGGHGDPRRALAELARVAVPGSPIVVVDEALDPRRPHGLLPRALFRAITFYEPAPRSPRDLLPPGAHDVVDEAITAFYYCLTVRVG